ncbi:MAG: 50S ribosomal protein L4 [Candidatus Kerfeldbacteria bacterium]|nr:50S ribosomal protein L4 [Candidatus Kerfeldbacteria bacterium]
MATIKVYNLKGESTKEITLDDKVFAVKADPKLVQFVVRAQRANAHIPYADTKTRSEVRGGGRKPWKQKGTGSARQGSIRAPQWRKGGIVFGPTSERNMTLKVNKKTRRKALSMVLSDKLADSRIVVVDSLDQLTGKTKDLSITLKKLPVKGRSFLIASAKKNDLLTRCAKNMPQASTMLADSLNVIDLLKYHTLVIDTAGVESILAQYSK